MYFHIIFLSMIRHFVLFHITYCLAITTFILNLLGLPGSRTSIHIGKHQHEPCVIQHVMPSRANVMLHDYFKRYILDFPIAIWPESCSLVNFIKNVIVRIGYDSPHSYSPSRRVAQAWSVKDILPLFFFRARWPDQLVMTCLMLPAIPACCRGLLNTTLSGYVRTMAYFIWGIPHEIDHQFVVFVVTVWCSNHFINKSGQTCWCFEGKLSLPLPRNWIPFTSIAS